jgi:hypothetical protein
MRQALIRKSTAQFRRAKRRGIVYISRGRNFQAPPAGSLRYQGGYFAAWI